MVYTWMSRTEKGHRALSGKMGDAESEVCRAWGKVTRCEIDTRGIVNAGTTIYKK